MTSLPNPEAKWTPAARLTQVERADVERRIGATTEPMALLPGGLANTNVRLGTDRVLRIYRRESSALGKEARLLQYGWKSFRAPKVLEAGDDFLVLEYVPHTSEVAERGRAVGRALAEIHAVAYGCSGLLGPSLEVDRPMPDFVDAALHYLESEVAEVCPDLRANVLDCIQAQADSLSLLSEESVLLHADFKASNLHWADSGELLVLDWEFAYAGPALMDVGQLFRWRPPRAFRDAFVEGYQEHGGQLPDQWERWASAFDLVNLMGLLAGTQDDPRRVADVTDRMRETMASL